MKDLSGQRQTHNERQNYEKCFQLPLFLFVHKQKNQTEYRGMHYEIREIEFEKKNSGGDSTGYETREVELNYSIWYKITD